MYLHVAGINIFLAGFVPTENMRFRDEALSFKVVEVIEEEKSSDKRATRYDWRRVPVATARLRAPSSVVVGKDCSAFSVFASVLLLPGGCVVFSACLLSGMCGVVVCVTLGSLACVFAM